MWYNLGLDVVKTDLCLKNSHSTINVEDLNDQWRLIVINLELDLRVCIRWCLALRRSCLPMLVPLVADNMGVVDIVKIFSAND